MKRVAGLVLAMAGAIAHASSPYPPEVMKNMNLSADPCNDLYEYACGAWLANTVRPPSQPVLDKSITGITIHNDAILEDILTTTADPKLKPFYNECMDRTTINSRGVAVMDGYRPKPVSSNADFAGTVGSLQASSLQPLFAISIVADPMDPEANLLEFDQGGFTLPSRDMYLSPSQLLTDYKTHIATMFTLVGVSAANASMKATAVVKFETALANASLPLDQIRDPLSVYHKSNLTNLMSIAPDFDWGSMFEAMGVTTVGPLNIAEPDVLAAVNTLVKEADVDTLNAYADWLFIHEAASNGALPDAFVTENFNFFGKEVEGEDAMPSLSSRCVSLTNNYLGYLLSVYYVEKAFAGDAKAEATSMVASIQNMFLADLQNVTWMDDVTKGKAVLKEQEMTRKVGFPANPPTYSDYSVIAGKLFETLASWDMLNFRSSVVSKIGQPADRTSFELFPDITNAYYDPLTNSINVMAGILQTPYFNATADPAINFAGAGVIVGHENSHGFDDQGRMYDGHGKLTNWWAPATAAKFEQRTTCLVEQYSSFEALPGIYVNGNLTLGENIADNGGVKTAYRAYLNSTSTPNEKLFWIAYVQGWCSLASPQAVKVQVETDPHSPAKFRAIGPVMNRPEFSDLFQCKPGSVMNPATKCEVW